MNWNPDKVEQEMIKELMRRSRPQFNDARKYLSSLVRREYLR
mgnify:CR=1 FL=1